MPCHSIDSRLSTYAASQEKEWQCTNTLAIFNLDKYEWEYISQEVPETNTTFPRPRAGHSAVVINSRLFIWSGRDGYRKAWSNQVCCKDLWFLEVEKPLPPTKISLSKATVSTFDLSWTPVPNADMYVVQILKCDPNDIQPPAPEPKMVMMPVAANAATASGAASIHLPAKTTLPHSAIGSTNPNIIISTNPLAATNPITGQVKITNKDVAKITLPTVVGATAAASTSQQPPPPASSLSGIAALAAAAEVAPKISCADTVAGSKSATVSTVPGASNLRIFHPHQINTAGIRPSMPGAVSAGASGNAQTIRLVASSVQSGSGKPVLLRSAAGGTTQSPQLVTMVRNAQGGYDMTQKFGSQVVKVVKQPAATAASNGGASTSTPITAVVRTLPVSDGTPGGSGGSTTPTTGLAAGQSRIILMSAGGTRQTVGIARNQAGQIVSTGGSKLVRLPANAKGGLNIASGNLKNIITSSSGQNILVPTSSKSISSVPTGTGSGQKMVIPSANTAIRIIGTSATGPSNARIVFVQSGANNNVAANVATTTVTSVANTISSSSTTSSIPTTSNATTMKSEPPTPSGNNKSTAGGDTPKISQVDGAGDEMKSTTTTPTVVAVTAAAVAAAAAENTQNRNGTTSSSTPNTSRPGIKSEELSSFASNAAGPSAPSSLAATVSAGKKIVTKNAANKANQGPPMKAVRGHWYDAGLFRQNEASLASFYAPRDNRGNVDYVEMYKDILTKTHKSLVFNDKSKFSKIDLEPGCSYKIRVAAVNSCGLGPWSEPHPFKTCVPGFPSAPAGVKITRNADGAHITWGLAQTGCNDPNETVEFNVFLAMPAHKGANTEPAFSRVYEGSQMHCVVPSAILNEAFIDCTSKPAVLFRLCARNAKGFGPATQVRWMQENIINTLTAATSAAAAAAGTGGGGSGAAAAATPSAVTPSTSANNTVIGVASTKRAAVKTPEGVAG